MVQPAGGSSKFTIGIVFFYKFGTSLFFFALMGYSFVTTALYMSTDSVIPCVIFHALINAFAELGFWVTEASLFTYVESLGRLVVGIVVFLVVMHRQRPRSASGASA